MKGMRATTAALCALALAAALAGQTADGAYRRWDRSEAALQVGGQAVAAYIYAEYQGRRHYAVVVELALPDGRRAVAFDEICDSRPTVEADGAAVVLRFSYYDEETDEYQDVSRRIELDELF